MIILHLYLILFPRNKHHKMGGFMPPYYYILSMLPIIILQSYIYIINMDKRISFCPIKRKPPNYIGEKGVKEWTESKNFLRHCPLRLSNL